MSRYDGLIIPRSYSEYINKTDAATLQQALQLPGVLSGAVAAGDNKAVTSNAVNSALENYEKRISGTVFIKKNVEILTNKTYSSWIFGGFAQGYGPFSDFLNLGTNDITKTYGFITFSYVASDKKITITSSVESTSTYTLLYLNGV